MSSRPSVEPFQAGDVGAIISYFVVIFAVGIWSSRRKKNDSVQGYFLAGRDMNWFLIGAGLFATNISSTHFVGLAGSAARSGTAIAGFELNAMFILLLLGWVFVPVYMAARVYTMPEYLRRRFGGTRIQTYLSGLSLLLSLLIRISSDLYAGAIFIEQTLDWNIYYSSIALLAAAGIYAGLGGLTAVMWTDLFQTIFVIAGASAIAILSFIEVGGYNELVENFPLALSENSANNTTCGHAPSNYMSLLRSADDSQYPWTGMVFGLTISAVWGWCSDQIMVQRCLAAKNLSHAKGGCVLAGYLKILPLFLFVFPGMAARIMFPNELACASPDACLSVCGSEFGCGDIAYPLLVLKLMPTGARGFMMSVMLAAIMGTLTSVFNSTSTLFTIDIWPIIRKGKKPSELELVIVGRAFVTILASLSVLWLPVIKASQGSQIFNYTQSVISYLGPPVCVIYVLAVFTNWINEKGAFWGLMVGLVLGLLRFVLDVVYSPQPCGSGTEGGLYVSYIPDIVSKVHYLHFGCLLFLVVLLVTLTVSWFTNYIDEEHLSRLTYWSTHSSKKRVDKDESDDKPSLENQTNNDTQNTMVSFEMADAGETNSNGNVFAKRVLSTLCCLKPYQTSYNVEMRKPTPEEDLLEASERISEKKIAKRILDVNGLVLLGVSIAIWIVYR